MRAVLSPRCWLKPLSGFHCLLVALAGLAVLPLLGVILWEQQRVTEARLVEAGQLAEELATGAARGEAALIAQAERFLAAIARLPRLTDDTPEACERLLEEPSGGTPWLRALGVFAADGQPLCLDQPVPMFVPEGGSLLDRPWFRAVLESRGFGLSDLLGRAGRPLLMAAQPVLDAEAGVQRVVVAVVELGWAGRRPPAGADALRLLDAGGQVVAQVPPAPQRLGRRLDGDGPDDPPQLLRRAAIPGIRAEVAVVRDVTAVLAPLRPLQREALGLAGGGVLFALLLALGAGRGMVLRPMAHFAAAVRRMDCSGFDARGTAGRFDGAFGALARQVNGMAARLARQQAACDAAEAASAAKSRFIGTLSHELRTMLNGLFGHAQLLGADPALTPAQRRSVDQITACGEHLLSMVRELLDLTAIEAGKVRLSPAPVRLATLAEACAAQIRPGALGKGLAFEVAVAPGAGGWVAADPLRLRQVLLNLLGNAVKFTAQGEVALHIRRTDAGMTRFEVSDTGPGISAAERALLFQEFARLPGTAEVEGSGLGLAITARLAGLMGGGIGCESEPGQGSLFWVELPLPPAEPLPEPVAGPRAALPPGVPLRLLLADDVPVNREVARALLSAAGHQVTLVADGAEAVAAALAEDWDAVLLDVHMPVMDGWTAARHIRAAPGRRARVPILAVTASASEAEIAACLAAGMDAHVEKPLRTAELQAVLAGLRARVLQPVAAA